MKFDADLSGGEAVHTSDVLALPNVALADERIPVFYCSLEYLLSTDNRVHTTVSIVHLPSKRS